MFERLRRHPVITLLLLFLCAAGTTLSVFLYSFDLNDYRNQLQDSLQEALQRPVRIGEIHFSLRHGLSLDLSDAAIGAAEEETSLTVDHLLLRLRVVPLLQRQQLSFSSILLEGAQLRIVSAAEKETAPPREAAAERMNTFIELLSRTRISTLVLRNGRITVTAGERRYELSNIDLQLHNIAFQTPISLAASGEMNSGGLRAPWRLAGTIEAAGAEAPWQKTHLDLNLEIKRVDLTQLSSLFAEKKNISMTGLPALTLRTHGTPSAGLNFELRAVGKDLAATLPALYSAPLRAQEALLAGTWQDGAPGTIRDLLLRLDTLSLQGKMVLPTATTPLITTLTLPETPLESLGRLIPDRMLPLLASTLRSQEVSGYAGMEEAELHWSQTEGLRLSSARLNLRDGRFRLKGVGLVEHASGVGAWQKNTLTLTEAKATLLGGMSTAQGNVTFPPKGEAILNFELTSTAQAGALTPLLPKVWQEKLQANGPISLNAKVSGIPSRLLIDLNSRFTEATLRFNNIPLKEAGETGELLILGAANATGLELSHARLILPFAAARANGRFALDNSGAYTLSCDITDLQIEKLPPFLAVQKELAGRGEVDLRLDLSGDQGGLKSLQGSGEFRKLGLHLWDAVADLRSASGRMLLSRDGIDFPAISGLIGLSPLRASAELKWLPEFQLVLDLDLAKTRAADLVFKSPQKTFQTVAGRLVITTTGILFEKLSARIADETEALINGRLIYHPASLDLDVAASRGNIAGIIALWQGGGKESHHPAPAAGASASPPLRADITASITRGDLFGVAFENANAMITLRDHELHIEPLRLKIGSGSGSVNIATSSLRNEHPLLKITGAVEGIDAAQVQRQLLGHQGSLSGTLESTFNLEGEIGHFLPTCNGKVTLRVEKGLMRGFTSISRALALFNVGKIVTFNLPDIDRDGLVFDRIKGNLTFTDGVVRSDDLALKSAAFDMAFVGQADFVKDHLDFVIGVKPLQTIDKVLSSIPLAGWILTGEKKAFVVANFLVTGSSHDPKVEAVPFSSLSDMAVGIFKRTFGLPGKIVNDVRELFQ